MGKIGPETKLIKRMLTAGYEEYTGARLVLWKNHGSEYSQAGVADLTGMLDGVALACEVKAPETYGGSIKRALQAGPTVKQRAFIAKVNASGGVGWFAASVEGFMQGLAWANRFAVTEWEG